MNSQTLKKSFPQIYQNFFSKCNLVCSAPRTFPWFGEQGVRYEGLLIRQFIPLRTYIGIVPQKEKSIKIVEYTNFDPATQKFKKENFDYYQQEKIEKYLAVFLKKEAGIELENGFGIHILNELPYERGLGSSVLFSSLISAILIYCQQIEKSDIENWRKAKSSDLKNDKNLKFDRLFRLLWKWENFLYPGASGANLISIIPTNSPILYFSKSATPSQVRIKKPLTINDLGFVDKSDYWAIKFNEIFNSDAEIIWPFDFGLIYAGENNDIRDSIDLLKKMGERLDDDARECENDLKIKTNNFQNGAAPEVYKICQNKESLWNKYINTLIVHSIQSYQTFKKAASYRFSREAFKELTELLNKEQNLFYLLNFSSPRFDHLTMAVRDQVKIKGQEDTIVATKMTGSTRRGDILFIANSHHIRGKINEIIAELKKEFGPEITLDYASWLDGYENEGGIKIEQFWQEKIYSRFVPEDSLVLKEIKGEEIVTRLSSYDKLKREAYAILLDTLENKIYIKGRPLTSKNLPSQAATIQILTALLESDTHSLSNSNLPSFSYTKYRNEMQGKIVSPLTKLTNGKIKISLEGGLMNFVVRLEVAKSAKIGILEKIG